MPDQPITQPDQKLPSSQHAQLPMSHWQKLPNPPRWKSLKKIIVGLGIVLLALVVITPILGFFGIQLAPSYYFKIQKAPSPALSPTSQPHPTSPFDQNMPKSTYTHPTSKYTFQYPQGWQIQESTTSATISLRKVYPELGTHVEHKIWIHIHAATNLSLEDWVNTDIISPAKARYITEHALDTTKQETATINGQTVILVSAAHLPAAVDTLHAYMMIEKNIVEVVLEGYSIGQDETEFDRFGRSVFNDIIASFMIISKESSTNTP